jgi:uncharacterized metal-binding protein YceD (DUF177 family)
MATMRRPADPARQAQLQAELKRDREQRQQGYRDRALKLFPHICARCNREFEGKRLRELTVHHRDHDHNNNPPDGSNWELLCIYCHDHEHEKFKIAGYGDGSSDSGTSPASRIANPFAALDTLIQPPPPAT